MKFDPHEKVSLHLTWGETTTTDHLEFMDAQHDLCPAIVNNITRFANGLFEEAREVVGPLHVNSLYRCPALNAVLPGHAKFSRHMDGLAADLVPLDMPMLDAYKALLKSRVAYDQLIWEYGRWIHLGDVVSGHPRGQALMIFNPGEYLTFDPNDRRLR